MAGSVAVHRRPIGETRALLNIVSVRAARWHVVVTATVQEVTVENCAACRRVVDRRVVFVAFAVDVMFTDSCRIVTAVDRADTQNKLKGYAGECGIY